MSNNKKKTMPEWQVDIMRDKLSDKDCSPVFKAMMEGVLKTHEKRTLDNLTVINKTSNN